MIIRFIEDVTVQDKVGRHYPRGFVAEMAEDACRHFVSRRKAVYVEAPKVEPRKEKIRDKQGIVEKQDDALFNALLSDDVIVQRDVLEPESAIQQEHYLGYKKRRRRK